MKLTLKLAVLLVVTSVAGGCSNRIGAIKSTFEDSLGGSDALRTAAVVETTELPSIFITINQQNTIFVALAVDEMLPESFDGVGGLTSIQKWLSADGVIIITQHGQLVATKGLLSDRTRTRFSTSNPFAVGLLNITDGAEFLGELSWQPGNHEFYPFSARYSLVGEQQLDLVLGSFAVVSYQEVVNIPLIGVNYTNRYWVDAVTGQILKSEQMITPNGDSILIEVARPVNASVAEGVSE
ncbi:MAG: YjbF family lipoprotein [Pseudomonadales bacterium]|jgi:hypothetical protein